MKNTRIIALGGAFALLGALGVQAQDLSSNPTPAEFPPSSFTGNQYVDSNGCIFIRAGIDGNTTWVPRVSRDRRQICGQQPTFAAPATQTATAAPEPEAAPVIVPASPRPAPSTVQSAPATTTAVATPQRTTSASTGQPMATVATTITQPATPAAPVAAAPVAAVPAAPQTTPAPASTQTTRVSACPDASALSQRFTNSGEVYPVRCGPQAEPSFGPIRAMTDGGQVTQSAGGGERILPSHLVASRTAERLVQVPEGYEPVWDDDRLNPRRAEQSVEGYKQSQRVMTRTVPRRDVSGEGPARIVEPRIVSREPIRTPGIRVEYSGSRPGEAAKAERAPQASEALFVRVGAFADAAQARAGAQRMARTGLPTRMGKLVQGGKTIPLVLAGPFSSRAEAQRAVSAARSAGFSRAAVMN